MYTFSAHCNARSSFWNTVCVCVCVYIYMHMHLDSAWISYCVLEGLPIIGWYSANMKILAHRILVVEMVPQNQIAILSITGRVLENGLTDIHLIVSII
jgi:hypothetical protein